VFLVSDGKELIHGNNPILLQYHMGTLSAPLDSVLSPSDDYASCETGSFLNPKTWKSVTLSAIERINHDSLIYQCVPTRYTLYCANLLIRLVLPSPKVQKINRLAFQLVSMFL
jgi:hypothetical protein